MNISIIDLIDCIRSASDKVEVCVPGSKYSHSGEYEVEDMNIIDSKILIAALEELLRTSNPQ